VRELENILEHALVYRREGRIEAEDLPAYLRRDAQQNSISIGRGTLALMEQRVIQEALARHYGNRRAAARELGIHPSTLYRKAGGKPT
jgi:transcriptional regulator with PAS, ATPase and Fis domain